MCNSVACKSAAWPPKFKQNQLYSQKVKLFVMVMFLLLWCARDSKIKLDMRSSLGRFEYDGVYRGVLSKTVHVECVPTSFLSFLFCGLAPSPCFGCVREVTRYNVTVIKGKTPILCRHHGGSDCAERRIEIAIFDHFFLVHFLKQGSLLEVKSSCVQFVLLRAFLKVLERSHR